MLGEQVMLLSKLLSSDGELLTDTSEYRESVCTWDCKMWFANERMLSGVTGMAAFMLAGVVVIVASFVFMLIDTSSDIGLFTMHINLNGEFRQKG